MKRFGGIPTARKRWSRKYLLFGKIAFVLRPIVVCVDLVLLAVPVAVSVVREATMVSARKSRRSLQIFLEATRFGKISIVVRVDLVLLAVPVPVSAMMLSATKSRRSLQTVPTTKSRRSLLQIFLEATRFGKISNAVSIVVRLDLVLDVPIPVSVCNVLVVVFCAICANFLCIPSFS